MDLMETYEQTAALFLERSSVIEVRLVGGGRTFSGFFSNAKSAAEAIAAVDGQRNVYLVANPIKQDAVRGTIGKLGQASNGNCVADSDIEKRGWLLFDIDNKRKGVSVGYRCRTDFHRGNARQCTAIP